VTWCRIHKLGIHIRDERYLALNEDATSSTPRATGEQYFQLIFESTSTNLWG
jgi:hypothetical protein